MAHVNEEILALERAALERWGNGDPSGYLECMASDVTYFDPFLAIRADGIEAMRRHFAPIVGKIQVERFEFLNPSVRASGNLAVLNFNLVDYVARKNRIDPEESRWDVTEVYERQNGEWKIVHSHFSLTNCGPKLALADGSPS